MYNIPGLDFLRQCDEHRGVILPCGNLLMNLSTKGQGQERSNYVYFSGFGGQRVDGILILVCEAYSGLYTEGLIWLEGE